MLVTASIVGDTILPADVDTNGLASKFMLADTGGMRLHLVRACRAPLGFILFDYVIIERDLWFHRGHIMELLA